MDWESIIELIVMNWLGIFSLIATIIIAIITINYRSRQHQINGLLDTFKILNNREHRSSRRKVYELYLEYEKYEDVLIFDGSPEVVDVGVDNIIHILLIT